MKINKDVYTQDLDKAYTILKQQYIIIKCLLELVDSNNLNEDEKAQLAQSIEDINLKIAQLDTDLNNLGNSVLNIRNTVNTLVSYYNSVKDYIVQNGNTTEIGGNLEVDGNGQINGNLNVNGSITVDGEPLELGSVNVVREDTLGEFLNTVFSYQSKEDIPNELQTNANINNLKNISNDTVAIVANYDSFDYVLHLDATITSNDIRTFIHGYIYNPNIKDIILVSINTTTGVATFRFNTDSSGTSESPILELNSVGTDLYTLLTSDTNEIVRPATTQEKTFFTDVINRLSNGEKIGGFITALSTIRAYFQFMTSDGNHITFKTSRLSLEYNYEYTVVYRSTYTDEEILVFKQKIYPQSNGSSEIISSTLEISNTSTYVYFKITNTLEEGFYDLVINANVYTFTTTIYYNPSLSNIGNATMGELGNYHYVFDFYTGNDYDNETRIYANVFKVDNSTGGITISTLKELCELVKSFTGSYPTLTLYKRK